MMIQIANPLYDVVFKYLMDDNDVAKTIISAIIEEDIDELDVLPQERILTLEKHPLTVYRLDFSAKIKTNQGDYKHVIIEIQKAKLPSDIMRFRRYLGEQYRKKDNIYIIENKGKSLKKAMPILTIYFLGHRLHTLKAPVIKVKRDCIDIRTGSSLIGKEEFIESLTHDSFIIQIPELPKEKRTELESLLSVFDQRYIADDSRHILAMNEKEYPKKYRKIIRRLQRAISEPEMKDRMDIEDEIIEDLQTMERDIAEKEKEIKKKEGMLKKKESVIKEKEGVIKEKEGVIKEKEGVIKEKEGVIKEKEGVIKEKEGMLKEKDRVIEELKIALSQTSKTK